MYVCRVFDIRHLLDIRSSPSSTTCSSTRLCERVCAFVRVLEGCACVCRLSGMTYIYVLLGMRYIYAFVRVLEGCVCVCRLLGMTCVLVGPFS